MKNALLFLAVFASCHAVAQLPKLQLVQIASGFSNPIDIKSCGDERIFIVEQAGRIRIMDKSGNIRATPFLDITTKVNSSNTEQGLLSLAFSPNYKQDSTFYVNYITGPSSGSTVISRFHVSADSNVAEAGSEKVLLTFLQPYVNHKGATLMFGPDGYLYDTQGDGGAAGDPQGNGQNKNTFLAKILRLDVSNQDTTYVIPPTNPFVDSVNAKGEIWAYGLRNPFRCSFDKFTGDTWIGDVGQNLYEEVDFQPAGSNGGQNYGWSCMEGFHTYNLCASTAGFTAPIFEYTHSTTNGCAVIGGYVYRGTRYSNLFGRYLFTDNCSGRFVDLRQTAPGVFVADTLQSFLTYQYSSFGQDNNNELYVAGHANGIIYHLTDTSNCMPVAYILPDSFTACGQVTLNALYSDSLSYEWYDSNGPVGDTTAQYIASSTGWYKVKAATAQADCQAFSDSVYVTVHPLPSLVPCHCLQRFCLLDSFVSLAGRFTPLGGTYEGAGVQGDSVLILATAGVGIDTILYTYTDSFGCVATATLNLQIGDRTPLIDSVAIVSFCAYDKPVLLSGFVGPPGGTYSGNGVVDDTIFNPAGAATGANAVSYTYINAFGCISSDTLNFLVNNKTALIDSIPPVTYCISDTAVQLEGFIRPAGGIYTGAAVANNYFNPIVGSVQDTVYYSYTNNYGCVSEDTFALVVSQCTGIKDVSRGFQFDIFPNPNNGSFKVELNSSTAEQIHFSIVDELGRLCFSRSIPSASMQTMQIDVPELSKGVYTVRLSGNNGIGERQLIIE